MAQLEALREPLAPAQAAPCPSLCCAPWQLELPAWESLGEGLEPLEEPLESCVAREKQQHSPVCLCRGRFRVLAPLPLLFGGRESPGCLPIARAWRERKRTFLHFPACHQGTGHPLPAVIDQIMPKKKPSPAAAGKTSLPCPPHLRGSGEASQGCAPRSPGHTTFHCPSLPSSCWNKALPWHFVPAELLALPWRVTGSTGSRRDRRGQLCRFQSQRGLPRGSSTPVFSTAQLPGPAPAERPWARRDAGEQLGYPRNRQGIPAGGQPAGLLPCTDLSWSSTVGSEGAQPRVAAAPVCARAALCS